MLTQAAIDHYGDQAGIARALGISPAAISKWGEVVPLESATAIEILTQGKLRVDPMRYPKLARALNAPLRESAA